MAALNIRDFTVPLSDEDPCGPDLDMESLEFMNYVARAEGVLPRSYFARDDEGKQVPFDRAKNAVRIEYGAEFDAINKFLGETRDLRLFTFGAKLLILSRDLAGFAECLKASAAALTQWWDQIHPRGEGGEYGLRAAILQSLDDMPSIVLPLQTATLVNSRRAGALTYRMHLMAEGEIPAPEGEEAPAAGTVQNALVNPEYVEMDALVEARDRIAVIRQALADMRLVWIDKAGFDQPMSFDRLTPMVEGMYKLLDVSVARRDPSKSLGGAAEAAPGDGAPAAGAAAGAVGVVVPVITGPIGDVDAAAAALDAALGYFRHREPSSPAVFLIAQSRALIGKSLLEVIQALFPNHVDQAIIKIGGDQTFDLPVERMAYMETDAPAPEEATESEGSHEEETSGDWGESGDSAGDGEGGDAEAADSDAAAGHADETSGAADGETAPQAHGANPPARPLVRNRAEAIGQLQAVAAFFRAAEPSNPIPLLMDRACALAQRDFLALISDILPGVGTRPSDSGY